MRLEYHDRRGEFLHQALRARQRSRKLNGYIDLAELAASERKLA